MHINTYLMALLIMNNIIDRINEYWGQQMTLFPSSFFFCPMSTAAFCTDCRLAGTNIKYKIVANLVGGKGGVPITHHVECLN